MLLDEHLKQPKLQDELQSVSRLEEPPELQLQLECKDKLHDELTDVVQLEQRLVLHEQHVKLEDKKLELNE